MGAAKLLKEKRATIFWTTRATHTINLMLEGYYIKFEFTLMHKLVYKGQLGMLVQVGY